MGGRVAARLQGDDYQHLFSWLNILQLLSPREPVELVEVEAPDAGSVDDVVIYPRDSSLPRQYWQIKFHVGMDDAYSTAALLARDTPKATSLLEKFWNAWRRLQPGTVPPVLGLVSTWAWDHNDPVAEYIRGADQHLKPEFLIATEPKALVAARTEWREHLGAHEEEFGRFVSALRFRLGYDCDSELRDRTLERMGFLGLRTDEDALLASIHQVREWIKAGTLRVTREVLEEGIKRLELRAAHPAPRPIVIALNTIERQSFDYDADHELDWCDYFEGGFPKGHKIVDPSLWNAKLLPELSALGRELSKRHERFLRIQGLARLSAWLATGYTFPEVARYVLEVPQGAEVWRSSAAPSGDFRMVSRESSEVPNSTDTDDIAVGISVTGSLEEDVTRYLKRQGIGVKALYFMRPENGVGRGALRSESDAVALARQCKEHIQARSRTKEAKVVHLFYFGPLGGAAFLGHMLNAVGAGIQVYEDQAPGYSPSFLLR